MATEAEDLQTAQPADWARETWTRFLDIGAKVADNLTQRQNEQQQAVSSTSTSSTGLSTKTLILIGVGLLALVLILRKL